MARYHDRENFLPFRKAELLALLQARGGLSPEDEGRLVRLYHLLQALYHVEFHQQIERLKDDFAPFDPDRATRVTERLSPALREEHEARLFSGFQEVLTRANYHPITADDLARAFQHESLFQISLRVELQDFERYLLYWRGDISFSHTEKPFLRRARTRQIPAYERVAMLLKFQDAPYFQKRATNDARIEPGSVVLKLFRNIPKDDLEMLFPNTQIGMTWRDRLWLGIPGVVGGVGVMLKAGAALLAAAGVLGLLLHELVSGTTPHYPSPPEMAAILGALLAVGGIAAWALKQWSGYRSRKLAFMKTLADSLYFRNLDNNIGVFHHLIDEAEEEECKEALLGYHFLLTAPGPLHPDQLDDQIEAWLSQAQGAQVDFEIDDALRKLQALRLIEPDAQDPARWSAVPLSEACRRLEQQWSALFSCRGAVD